MSQLIFPSLPGITWPVTRTVVAPPVSIKTTPSRREFRARDSSVPLYVYRLAFEFLRIGQAYQEWQQLMGFFNKVGGTFDDWLFEDEDDRTATEQTFAVGDGVTSTFQLARSLGGFVEPVYGVNGEPVIKVGGTTTAPASTSPNGVVAFSSAPANGALLSWSGNYFQRCRFNANSLEFTKNYTTFYEAKAVEFITTKPL